MATYQDELPNLDNNFNHKMSEMNRIQLNKDAEVYSERAISTNKKRGDSNPQFRISTSGQVGAFGLAPKKSSQMGIHLPQRYGSPLHRNNKLFKNNDILQQGLVNQSKYINNRSTEMLEGWDTGKNNSQN